MGTHLRALSESYPVNTNMTWLRWFPKIFVSYSLPIGFQLLEVLLLTYRRLLVKRNLQNIYCIFINIHARFFLFQEYSFPIARDREFLIGFHKDAKKNQLDVAKYNELQEAKSRVELDIKRLRDPLQLHLPIQQLMMKDKPSQ